MGVIVAQITSLTIVHSTIYSDADQSKHQSSASLAFVLGIHPGPVNSPHKWPVTRKMFPFDDVIMQKLSSGSVDPGCPQSSVIVYANLRLIKVAKEYIQNMQKTVFSISWIIILINTTVILLVYSGGHSTLHKGYKTIVVP